MSRYGKDAALLLLLCALGVGGNLSGYQVFYSIEFVFGSIFSLLALQLLGPIPGVVASLCAALVTYWKWNHPYALVILVLEAVVLAGFTNKKRSNFIIVDALFWLLVGMPLVYAFYFGVMDLATANVKLTMLKQGVNGLFNAMIARFIFMLLGFGKQKRQIPIKELLFLLLFMFVLAPSLYLIAIQSHDEQQSIDRRVRETLTVTADRVKGSVDDWLEEHIESIRHLQTEAAKGEYGKLQDKLDQICGAERAFKYIGFFDKDATAVAFSPKIDEMGRVTLKINYGDRPYLGALKSELKPMLSELVMSRVDNPRPITMILVPFLDKGRWNGYLAGILEIPVLDRVIARSSTSANLPGMSYILLDKNDRVITSNRKSLKIMAPYIRPDGYFEDVDDGIRRWLPMVAKNISISDKWRKAVYVREEALGPQGEWKLLLETPIEPFQKRISEAYFFIFVRLCIVLGIALVAALLIAHVSISSIRKLESMTSGLPKRLAAGEEPEMGESVIFEVSRLMGNYRQMVFALKDKFTEIKRLNESLEGKIARRTSELAALNRQQDAILNTALIGIALLKDGRVAWANPAHYRIFGFCPGDVEQNSREIGDSFSADYAALERENRQTLLAGVAHQTEMEFTRRSGERVYCVVAGSYIYPDKPEEGSIWSVADVTLQRRTQLALERSNARYDLLARRVPVGVYVYRTNSRLQYSFDYVSPKMSELLDVGVAELLDDAGIVERNIHKADLPGFLELNQHSAKTREVFRWEGRFLVRSEIRWLRIESDPTPGNDDETVWNGVVIDITDRKAAEEKLQTYAEVQRVLLREVNHRVKNNLSTILGVLHLEESRARDRGLSDVSEILGEVESRVRSLSMAHTLLSVTEWRPVSLTDLATRVIAGSLSALGAVEPDLSVAHSGTKVDASKAHHLALILSELSTNTAKHSGQGGRDMAICVGIAEEAGFATLTYRDNGKGYRAEMIASPDKTESTGITLIRGLVEKSLGGKLAFSNQGGAVATICFPLGGEEGEDEQG